MPKRIAIALNDDEVDVITSAAKICHSNGDLPKPSEYYFIKWVSLSFADYLLSKQNKDKKGNPNGIE